MLTILRAIQCCHWRLYLTTLAIQAQSHRRIASQKTQQNVNSNLESFNLNKQACRGRMPAPIEKLRGSKMLTISSSIRRCNRRLYSTTLVRRAQSHRRIAGNLGIKPTTEHRLRKTKDVSCQSEIKEQPKKREKTNDAKASLTEGETLPASSKEGRERCQLTWSREEDPVRIDISNSIVPWSSEAGKSRCECFQL
jgi:hypothetical protein